MMDRIQEANRSISVYVLLSEYGQTVDSARARKIYCPVHDDRNKSAVSYPDSNEVYCFTCHKTYDPVGLLVALEGLTHLQACEWIEERAGVVYTQTERPEDRFWAMLRTEEKRRAGEVTSSEEAYRLRWQIHQTVLELARGEVDWESFDVAGLDIGILKSWRDRMLNG